MRFTASSYRYRRGYSAKNDGGPGYSGSKAQNGYKPTRNLMGLDFVNNKTESPLDGISKNVTYKLDTTVFQHPHLVHLVRELQPSRALASISLDRWSRLAGPESSEGVVEHYRGIRFVFFVMYTHFTNMHTHTYTQLAATASTA